jgi:hypothetical protein
MFSFSIMSFVILANTRRINYSPSSSAYLASSYKIFYLVVEYCNNQAVTTRWVLVRPIPEGRARLSGLSSTCKRPRHVGGRHQLIGLSYQMRYMVSSFRIYGSSATHQCG